MRDALVSSINETAPLDPQTLDPGCPPRKKWETPTFEQHDVRSITLGKSNNSNETNGVVGPLS
jgi:hypothetical protein